MFKALAHRLATASFEKLSELVLLQAQDLAYYSQPCDFIDRGARKACVLAYSEHIFDGSNSRQKALTTGAIRQAAEHRARDIHRSQAVRESRGAAATAGQSYGWVGTDKCSSYTNTHIRIRIAHTSPSPYAMFIQT
jgi:hypothetical protein